MFTLYHVWNHDKVEPTEAQGVRALAERWSRPTLSTPTVITRAKFSA